MPHEHRSCRNWQTVTSIAMCVIALLLLDSRTAFPKDAGDLLQQYVDGKVLKDELLALVEIASVQRDEVPEGNWKETGTLNLVTIEAIGEGLPARFSVRYKCRTQPAPDAWTWDQASLKKGQRLIGFFNSWNDSWSVRGDGRTNVINNPEQIEPELLAKVQTLFKTPLVVSDLEVQIARFRGLLGVEGADLRDVMHVIVRNRSQRPVAIWDQWNGWGYHTVTLQGSWKDGREIRWTRFGGLSRSQNAPDSIELTPGESYVFDVRLVRTDPKTQSHSWGPVDMKDDYPTVKLRAVFSIKEDEETPKHNVWTGTVVSPIVELRLKREYVNDR